MNTDNQKPLVYACSGCSSAARLASDLAVVMNNEGLVEMSCIAGVSCNLINMVELAKSGRPILALDGCHQVCVKRILALHNIEPTWHIQLTELGIKKNNGETCTMVEQYHVLNYTYRLLNLIPAENPQTNK